MSGTEFAKRWTAAWQQQAVHVLNSGGVVAYPTETVWGLATRPEHVQQLFVRKGRAAEKAVQVSCAACTQALALATPDPVLEHLTIFWPGPLTVVARAKSQWGQHFPALAPGGWVGLRVPSHALAQDFLQAAGGPLATTSLNPSGLPAACTWAEAVQYDLADLVLEEHTPALPTPTLQTLASSVIQLPAQPGDHASLLRAGALPTSVLRARLAEIGVTLELPA